MGRGDMQKNPSEKPADFFKPNTKFKENSKELAVSNR